MSEYPERIPHHVWMNSQLSIARFYGGCQLGGKMYLIEKKTGDLVCRSKKPRKNTNKQKP
jgi:hypothetical protein